MKPVLEQKKPFLVRLSRLVWRLASDRAYRHVRLVAWRRPQGSFQPYNMTAANRYPVIFRFVAAALGAQSEARILSYGCSTGEEVFTLRRYFPRAAIKGIDINPGNIASCRRRLTRAPDLKLAFDCAASTEAEPTAAYDAVFCMAVFRHGGLGLPGVTRCDNLLRFADFARAVDDIERCLKPGGLLVIRHSNFRLCDTPAGTDFETILSVPIPAMRDKTPVFGLDNALMPGVDYPDAVFRKRV